MLIVLLVRVITVIMVKIIYMIVIKDDNNNMKTKMIKTSHSEPGREPHLTRLLPQPQEETTHRNFPRPPSIRPPAIPESDGFGPPSTPLGSAKPPAPPVGLPPATPPPTLVGTTFGPPAIPIPISSPSPPPGADRTQVTGESSGSSKGVAASRRAGHGGRDSGECSGWEMSQIGFHLQLLGSSLSVLSK